ncbi:cupredoxin domain-containing protein [Arthrobacter flavus]|uniref:Cupredoxin domain-containing protein n=1 Tax=Arthrobacter flavus TaxID=95172 RepID=A0ABW4Q6D0_9MICC
MKINHPVAGILLAVALVGIAGCGASDDTGTPAVEPQATTSSPAASSPAAAPAETTESAETPAEAAEEVVITITDFEYEVSGPVAPGAEVTVINNDSVGHTVTSDEEGLFDSVFGPNETVTFTAPEEAGEYSFFCTPHPGMISTLVVEE